MTAIEALDRVRELFGQDAHIQDEVSYGRPHHEDEFHHYWVFVGKSEITLCGHSEQSWAAAIQDTLARRSEMELALKATFKEDEAAHV